MNVQHTDTIKSAAWPVAAFIQGLRADDIPADALHMARRCLLDTLAIWAAGQATKPSRIARDHAARRYPGTLPMPFDGRLVNPVGYAFAGATTVDAIDGHDGHQLCKGHASVALVPALLAELGRNPEGTLDDLLVHFIAGQEIAIRAGLSLHSTVPDYHSSGAWNALGCAAIAARLRGFDSEQIRQALGIAEYYGPRAQMMRCIDHPTMVKDSSGWGALAGISAADLAEDGFTGAPAITCEAHEVAALWRDLGQVWRITETNFKAHPVCRWAHPPVEAVLSLMASHPVAQDEIAEIKVTTFHEATRLQTRRPVDGDAAQYSLPLCVAQACRHGALLPEHMLPENFDQPEVWALVDKVSFAESDDYNAVFPQERYADVTLSLTSGKELRSDKAVARGNFDAPLSDTELLDKFIHYFDGVLDADAQQAIMQILREPARAPDAASLIGLLNPNGAVE